MDELVKAAMAKWPNVPDCYGWLGLDARGQWHMRDEQAQRAGPFAGAGSNPVSRGAVLLHDKLKAFIHRNYAADAQGQWFFQNGPQRVYIELEVTPWIWRLSPQGGLTSHTGIDTECISSWLDERGRLLLLSPIGLGLVHTQDMHQAAEWVDQGLWVPQECIAADLPSRFGYVLSPQSGQ